MLRMVSTGKVRGVNCFSPHAHKCKKCKAIWEHDPEKIKSEACNIKAHTCPKCGKEQYVIYKGKQNAEYLNTGRKLKQFSSQPKNVPRLPGDRCKKVRVTVGPTIRF